MVSSTGSSPAHALAFRAPSSIPSHHALPNPARTDYLLAVAPSHVPGDARSQPSFAFPRESLPRSSAHDQDVPRQTHGSVPPPSWAQPHNELCTMLLAGEAFVQCSLVDHDGRRVAMFVFSVRSSAFDQIILGSSSMLLISVQDLAVRKEGRYRLRYRVFNIFGHHHHEQNRPTIPVLAECYGGTFEVFSTKTFPGLQVSTDLTKVSALAPPSSSHGMLMASRLCRRSR